MGKRRSFTTEFKQEAVQLAQQPDVALSQVARDLALSESLLRRWVQTSNQKGEAAFPGTGKPGLNAEQAEIQRLKRALDIARQERDILKKAVVCLEQNGTCMGPARFGMNPLNRTTSQDTSPGSAAYRTSTSTPTACQTTRRPWCSPVCRPKPNSTGSSPPSTPSPRSNAGKPPNRPIHWNS